MYHRFSQETYPSFTSVREKENTVEFAEFAVPSVQERTVLHRGFIFYFEERNHSAFCIYISDAASYYERAS